MKYYIKRDVNEYGPYSLADLQRYVGQGNIVMTDLARSEGLADWVPVSQVLGNIPVPVAVPGMAYSGVPAAGAVYGGTPGYSVAAAPATATRPVPPDLHWALVLLLTCLTCFLFLWAWIIVEAVWVRKIKPQNKGLLLVLLALGCVLASVAASAVWEVSGNPGESPFSQLLSLAALVLNVVAAFVIRSDLEDYYNTTENIGLSLSGVMTFFFAPFYFQYHFSRIARWKKTGVLEPQG